MGSVVERSVPSQPTRAYKSVVSSPVGSGWRLNQKRILAYFEGIGVI